MSTAALNPSFSTQLHPPPNALSQPSTSNPTSSTTNNPMNVVGTTDFSSLLASSSSLLSSTTNPGSSTTTGGGGSTTTSVLKKSLRELGIASASLGQNDPNISKTTNAAVVEASAHRLLASAGQGFSLSNLHRDTRNLSFSKPSTASSAVGGVGVGGTGQPSSHHPSSGVRFSPSAATHGGGGIGGIGSTRDLESYLKSYTDNIVHSSLVLARMEAEDCLQNKLQENFTKNYNAEKKTMLSELAGYRLMTSGSIDPPQAQLQQHQQQQHQQGVVFGNVGVDTPYAAKRAGGGGAYGDNTTPLKPTTLDAKLGSSSSSQDNNVQPMISFVNAPTSHTATANSSTTQGGDGRSHRSVNTVFGGGGSNLNEEARRHVAIIANCNNQRRNNHGVNLTEVMDGFEKVASDLARIASSGSNANIYAAYGNAWGLLSSMLLQGDLNNMEEGMRVREMSVGALQHLCRHYKNHVKKSVRSAVLAGRIGRMNSDVNNTGGGDALCRDVKRFVQLEMGQLGDALLWPRAYFCLRCGDAGAALETLQDSSESNIESPIVELVSLLAQRQAAQGDAALWYDSSVNRGNRQLYQPQQDAIISSLRETVVELYHRSKTRSANSAGTASATIDRYKIAALALLSLAEPLSTACGGVIDTIEDYMYADLWFSIQQTTGDDGASSSTSAGHWIKQLSKLGKLVKHWGPSHFEGDTSSSGGWCFAIPLIVSQQFKSALTYLAEVGGEMGLLQATHLGLILNMAGVDLRDLEFGASGVGEHQPSGVGPSLLASLLVSYSGTLQNLDPEAALEYLVRAPEIDQVRDDSGRIGKLARRQIRRLILETRAFEILAGRVSSDGSRQGGALDAHLSSSAEVSSLLAEAAEEALREGNVGDAAELLVLAGRYGALISLLNRELASLLVVEGKESEKRRFWCDAALRFHSAHLANGRTHVVEVLEAEDNLALGSTFQLMMNLMVFFDRCRDREWEEAWSLVDSLHLFPRQEDEIAWQVESFHSMDSVVKQCFHHIVLGAMECLYQQHAMIKSGASSSGQSIASAGAAEQRLIELRKRARLLVTFAGLINLSSSGDTSARIARMEAYMM